MKHLFLTSLFFLASFNLYAADPHEQVTSGVLGLLIPTTGYLDTGRRLDDKYNKNFRMIASTANDQNTRLNTVATDTTTIYTALQSTAVSLSNLQTTVSTLTAEVNNLEMAFSTGNLHVSNTNYIELSGSTQTKIGGLNISGNVNASSFTVDGGTFVFSSRGISPYTTIEIRRGWGSGDTANGNLVIGNRASSSGGLALKNLSGGDLFLMAQSPGRVILDGADYLIGAVSLTTFMSTVTAAIAGVSTSTIIMPFPGDISIATGAGNSPCIWNTAEDTYTFVSVQPFINFPSSSTMHTKFSVKMSTEQNASNFLFQPIHTSSFVVAGNNVYGNMISSFDVTSTFYPHQKIGLFVTETTISSGTTASEGGVNIQLWKWPRQ